MATNKYRITDFGENQRKGIDLAILALKKQYPFIKGWKLGKREKDYVTLLSIDIIVDFEKVAKYYNVEMNEFWIKQQKTEVIGTPYILNLSKNNENSFEETKKIKKDLKDIYNKQIPKRFITFWGMETEYGNVESECDLSIDDFISDEKLIDKEKSKLDENQLIKLIRKVIYENKR